MERLNLEKGKEEYFKYQGEKAEELNKLKIYFDKNYNFEEELRKKNKTKKYL